MIDPRDATIVVLILATVTLVAWAIYVATNDVPNRRDTISHIMSQWGKRYWALPFSAGVLAGHFWVTGVPWRPVHPVVTGLVLIPAAAGVALLGFRFRDLQARYWPAIAVGLIVAGIALGSAAWPI